LLHHIVNLRLGIEVVESKTIVLSSLKLHLEPSVLIILLLVLAFVNLIFDLLPLELLLHQKIIAFASLEKILNLLLLRIGSSVHYLLIELISTWLLIDTKVECLRSRLCCGG
jgi:hypothetical protein